MKVIEFFGCNENFDLFLLVKILWLFLFVILIIFVFIRLVCRLYVDMKLPVLQHMSEHLNSKSFLKIYAQQSKIADSSVAQEV
jgi:hypothetical protein